MRGRPARRVPHGLRQRLLGKPLGRSRIAFESIASAVDVAQGAVWIHPIPDTPLQLLDLGKPAIDDSIPHQYPVDANAKHTGRRCRAQGNFANHITKGIQ